MNKNKREGFQIKTKLDLERINNENIIKKIGTRVGIYDQKAS